MRINMKHWVCDLINSTIKKGLPILSFPGIQLIDHTVEEIVKDGHLQAKCMKAITERYDTGAAFSLMDLSVEAEAFGSIIHYTKDEVPTLHDALILNEEDVKTLQVPKVGDGRTGECIRGMEEASKCITDRPVFAGIIGPYSLAGRLLDMTEIMVLCYEEPELVEDVLEKATEFLIEYAKAMKKAGVNGVCMAEPAAGLLSPSFFEKFSTPYVQRVREAVEDEEFLFMYHNCGNIVPLLDSIKELGMHAYSFGNAIDLEKALKTLPEDALVIGNIDPAGILCNGSIEMVKKETRKLLERCGKYKNFVISSGCDIPPMTPLDNLDAFFETVQEFYEENL